MWKSNNVKLSLIDFYESLLNRSIHSFNKIYIYILRGSTAEYWLVRKLVCIYVPMKTQAHLHLGSAEGKHSFRSISKLSFWAGEWCSVLLCSADFKHQHFSVCRTQAKFEIIGVSTNKLPKSAFSEIGNGNRKNVYLSRFRTAFLQIKQYITM